MIFFVDLSFRGKPLSLAIDCGIICLRDTLQPASSHFHRCPTFLISLAFHSTGYRTGAVFTDSSMSRSLCAKSWICMTSKTTKRRVLTFALGFLRSYTPTYALKNMYARDARIRFSNREMRVRVINKLQTLKETLLENLILYPVLLKIRKKLSTNMVSIKIISSMKIMNLFEIKFSSRSLTFITQFLYFFMRNLKLLVSTILYFRILYLSMSKN